MFIHTALLKYSNSDFHPTSIGVNKNVTFTISFMGNNKKSKTATGFSWL